MGLDMFLEKYTYVGNQNAKDLDRPMATIQYPGIQQERVSTVIEELGYWRKANAIHAWFVEHVQGGVDECQRSWVSREQLQELLDTVNEVIAAPSRAQELLPTKSGFLFGRTDYDQWYMKELEFTREILTKALAEESEGNFYYRASW